MSAAGEAAESRGETGSPAAARGLALYDMPGHLVRRLNQIHSALFAEECGEQGLTSLQYAALSMLRAFPHTDATRLSALIAFDRSTIGSMLDRLEAKRLIERAASPGDRRVKLLSLTEAGKAVLDAAETGVRRVQDQLLLPLTPPERATMIRLMRRIAESHNETTSAPLRMD